MPTFNQSMILRTPRPTKPFTETDKDGVELSGKIVFPQTGPPVSEKKKNGIIAGLKSSLGLDDLIAVVVFNFFLENRYSAQDIEHNIQVALRRSSNSYDRVRFLMSPTDGIKVYTYPAACILWGQGVQLEPIIVGGERLYVRPENKQFFKQDAQ